MQSHWANIQVLPSSVSGHFAQTVSRQQIKGFATKGSGALMARPMCSQAQGQGGCMGAAQCHQMKVWHTELETHKCCTIRTQIHAPLPTTTTLNPSICP